MIVGAVMFLVGLIARPGGTPGLIALAGGGAVLLFLGAASVSSTVAKPVTKLIGWPVAKIYKAPGQLASENAGRAPRRTSATVAALMIGVALVSAAAVFAASIRTTFEKIMDRGVTADWVVTGDGFALPTGRRCPVTRRGSRAVGRERRARRCRSRSTVTRSSSGRRSGRPRAACQRRPREGSWEGLQEGGIFVHNDPAEDLGLEVGSTVEATFQNGEVRELPVAGIYADAALVGNWLMSSTMLNEIVSR